MKFEEALSAMRVGAKITHPRHFETDVYFQACRMGMMFSDTPLEEQPLSIVKMKGDYIHEDMGMGKGIDDLVYPGTMQIKDKYLEKPCKHGNFPQLNLLLIMSDDWEIMK